MNDYLAASSFTTKKPPPRPSPGVPGEGEGNRLAHSVRSQELNLSTRGQWELFRSHREHIERLVLQQLPERHRLLLDSPRRRMCALGAGNCNDLDLRFLCQQLDELHLLDIDSTSLESAARRQKVSDAPNLFRHAPIDLTAPDKWTDEIGRFDVVLSSCVLSQLIAGVRDRLGAEHRCFPAERQATIEHHLQLMLRLLAPGGIAILITDVVSSDTFPRLRQIPSDDLPGVMRELIADDKTFRGLDPATIGATLDQLGNRSKRCWIAPWLWHLSALRSYMVYALILRVG
jgi:SAM-dependent methyltransferase